VATVSHKERRKEMAIIITLLTVGACIVVCIAKALNEKI
jgi:hypothetical protein